MIPAPTEPCYFFIREHDLRRDSHTPWIITGYDAASKTYPYTYFTQHKSLYNHSTLNWRRYTEPKLRQAIQLAAVHSSVLPRPTTLYEVVRIPKRLVDFLSADKVRELVENIKESMLLSNSPGTPRQQYAEVMEVSIKHLPDNDMDAGFFYTTGAQYFHLLEAVKQQHTLAAQAAAATATKTASSPPPPPAAPTPTPAPAPTVTQQVIRARTRGARRSTVAEQFAYLKRLGIIGQKTAPAPAPEATPLPLEAPKP